MIQYFNSAIKSAPHLAEPYYYRGLAKYSLDDYPGQRQIAMKPSGETPFSMGHFISEPSVATHWAKTLSPYKTTAVSYATIPTKGALHNSALLQMALKDSIGARATLTICKGFTRLCRGIYDRWRATAGARRYGFLPWLSLRRLFDISPTPYWCLCSIRA